MLLAPDVLYFLKFVLQINYMQKITAAITAVGGFVPKDVLTNADFEKMVDTNDEWIKSRTGIEERHILKGEGLATSDLVVPAVQDLCKRRGIDPNEIDCMIVATITPDMFFPNTEKLSSMNLNVELELENTVKRKSPAVLKAATIFV